VECLTGQFAVSMLKLRPKMFYAIDSGGEVRLRSSRLFLSCSNIRNLSDKTFLVLIYNSAS